MTDPVYVPDDVYPKISRYVVDVGDVLLTIAGTIGEVAIVKERFHGANLTENAVKIKVSRKGCLEEYLSYYLQVDFVHEHLNIIAAGAAQPKLGLYKIRGFRVQLPDLSVQKKVVQIVSAYDELIENNLKRIKLLEEKAQKTYEEWFVRMRFPGHESTPIDPDTGLPEGWISSPLKELGNVVTGKTPSKSEQKFYGNDVPFVKTPDMAFGPYVLRTNEWLSREGANSQKTKYLPKHSLLVSCIGTAGKCALTATESQCNQQINAVKFFDEEFTFYGYCFASRLKPLLDALGSNGATMTNVNKGKFERIEMLVPTKTVLLAYHNKAKGCFDAILNLIEQNVLLEKSRDILLPRLMTGMIDVEDLDVELPMTA